MRVMFHQKYWQRFGAARFPANGHRRIRIHRCWFVQFQKYTADFRGDERNRVDWVAYIVVGNA